MKNALIIALIAAVLWAAPQLDSILYARIGHDWTQTLYLYIGLPLSLGLIWCIHWIDRRVK